MFIFSHMVVNSLRKPQLVWLKNQAIELKSLWFRCFILNLNTFKNRVHIKTIKVLLKYLI